MGTRALPRKPTGPGRKLCPNPGVHLIRTKKRIPIGVHYAVWIHHPKKGISAFFDFGPKGGWWTELDEFAEIGSVVIVESVGLERAREIFERAEAIIEDGIGYHAVTVNCEHVARWVFKGKAESVQIQSICFVGAMVALAVIAGRELNMDIDQR